MKPKFTFYQDEFNSHRYTFTGDGVEGHSQQGFNTIELAKADAQRNGYVEEPEPVIEKTETVKEKAVSGKKKGRV